MMHDYSEWKAALRLQIEALARRNDLHRRCNRSSVKARTQEMENKIVKLRELLQTDANKCAQFYLECVCHADETERILNRTSSRIVKKKNVPNKGTTSDNNSPAIISIPGPVCENVPAPAETDNWTSDRVPHDKRWWEQLAIHRRQEYYAAGKHEVRQMFRTQRDFLLSCLGLIIGIGQVIRFPALIYEFDGGVFLIPYITCHLLIGLPLMYLQLAIGQWTGLGAPAALAAMAPIASGLGWAFIVSGFIFAIYMNVYVAWSLHFIFQSVRSLFMTNVPWEKCSSAEIFGKICCDLNDLENCAEKNATVLSSEVYFLSTILNVTSPLDYSFSLQGFSVIAFLVAWLFTTAGSLRFTHASGLSVTLVTVAPYVFMMILFLRGIALPGAHEGISFLMNIDIELLFASGIWRAAVQQVFYELTLNTAPLITFSALSRFKNNIFRDSVSLLSLNILSSILSALIVFSYIGYFSNVLEQPVKKIIAFEPHYLSFYIYPAITTTMKSGPIWSLLLFTMLMFITLDAQYSLMEMIATSVLTRLSSLNRRLQNKLIIGICLMSFLCGLPFCTKGGLILFHTLDKLIACAVPCFLSLALVLVVTQIYGVKEIFSDISYMIRMPLLPIKRWVVLDTSSKMQAIFGPIGLFMKYCWIFITPSMLIILLFLHVTDYKLVTLSGKHVPYEIESLGWFICGLPVLVLPFFIMKTITSTRRKGKVIASLFDSSVWTQMHRLEPVNPSSAEAPEEQIRRRRTAMRENTYVYIDALSRANTTQDTAIFNVEDNYGWRIGKLQDMQETSSIPPNLSSASLNSGVPSLTSHSSQVNGEITLFGSPPASNAFMLAEVISERKKSIHNLKLLNERRKEDYEVPSASSSSENIILSTFNLQNASKIPKNYKKSCSSDPPTMRPYQARTSPCRSEPPMVVERIAASIRSRSESDQFSDDSDSYYDDQGIRRERRTVIRRLPSEDLQSASNVDMIRQRSLSSVAIFNNEDESTRPKNKLSQLKRPAPINVPTRF